MGLGVDTGETAAWRVDLVPTSDGWFVDAWGAGESSGEDEGEISRVRGEGATSVVPVVGDGSLDWAGDRPRPKPKVLPVSGDAPREVAVAGLCPSVPGLGCAGL